MLLLSSPPEAKAIFAISFQTSSGTTTVLDGGAGDTNVAVGKIGYSGTIDGFDISVFLSTSNSPGSSTLAQVAIGSLDLNNTLGTSNNIVIRAADQGFLVGSQGAGTPAGPLTLTSSVSGMVTPGVAGDISNVKFQSFADAGNNPLSTFPFGSAFATTQLNSGNLTSDDGSSVGFNLKTGKQGFNDPSAPYSLASALDITLSGGSSLNAVSGKTEIAVPEPASLAMAFVGLSVLGFGGWLRRGRKKA